MVPALIVMHAQMARAEAKRNAVVVPATASTPLERVTLNELPLTTTLVDEPSAKCLFMIEHVHNGNFLFSFIVVNAHLQVPMSWRCSSTQSTRAHQYSCSYKWLG